ncbi:biotin-dependent carboxyltransferase family protein [bacterium LRH843]|nr:biotin-dependent carboxyltransferase family protein [bacterium LRH843]
MSQKLIEVVKPGMLTTVQDVGRYRHLKDGIVAAGVMDRYAYEMANRLVGNKGGEAVLECTLVGPRLRFLHNATISLCGADLSPQLDGESVRTWWAIPVKKGQTLSFGEARDGMRTYLAVRGGIDVPLVLGSRSTYLKGGLGGFKGRALQKGDILSCYGGESDSEPLRSRGLNKAYIPNYMSGKPFQVILGPDEHRFSEKGIETFLLGQYKITQESDRMGCRLQGEQICHKDGADILSDAVTFGTIQVPGDGQPIVLLADRQTTGGYARIGHIVSDDLPRFVQQKPGTIIRFVLK